LNDFIERLKQTGSITRKSGSGRPRTARTTANIDAVDELVLSQEDAHRLTVQYDRLREKRVFILLAQHQFVNIINVGVVHAVLGLRYHQTFLLSIQFVSNAE